MQITSVSIKSEHLAAVIQTKAINSIAIKIIFITFVQTEGKHRTLY